MRRVVSRSFENIPLSVVRSSSLNLSRERSQSVANVGQMPAQKALTPAEILKARLMKGSFKASVKEVSSSSDSVKKDLEQLNSNLALNLYMNYQNQFEMDIPTFLKVHGVKDSNPFKQFISSINLITGSKKSQIIDFFSNPLLNDLLS